MGRRILLLVRTIGGRTTTLGTTTMRKETTRPRIVDGYPDRNVRRPHAYCLARCHRCATPTGLLAGGQSSVSERDHRRGGATGGTDGDRSEWFH